MCAAGALTAPIPAVLFASAAPMVLARFHAVWLALLVLAAAPAVAQTAPTVGEARTQTLRLAPGPNLVSLSILPDEPSIAAMFEHAVADLMMVRDSRGRHFAPGHGSPTLTAWSWADAYLVHVRDSVHVSVSGQTISPGTPLPLTQGWNDVPFLLPVPTAIETALASILPNVRQVEDAGGRIYPGIGNRPVLSTMMPGEGYRIHMRRADTLYYVAPTAPPPGPTTPPPPGPTTDRTVNTLAEALALTDLAAGQTIEVRGYHTAGDGGGGLFRVSDQGERPDGGTVFVPEPALGPLQTHIYTGPHYDYGPVLPEGVHVPHRNWTMTYTPTSGSGPFVINAWQHLAGHNFASRNALHPHYNVRGTGWIGPHLRNYYGEGSYTIAYRATTSPQRLVRQGVGSELNVRWFGARTESEAPNPAAVTVGSDFDVQVAITWAVNLAQQRNEPRFGGTPGTVTTIRVPAGTYRFAGPVELTDGLTLAGDGGTEVVDATTTVRGAAGVPEADVSAQLTAAGYAPGVEVPWAGYRTAPGGSAIPETPGSIARWSHTGGQLTVHYRPVRVKTSGVTRLRLFDGVVAKGLRMAAERIYEDALAPDVNFSVGKYQTSVTATSSSGEGPDVMAIGVRDLVLDGNHEGNRELWTEGIFGYNGHNAPQAFENWMRNTPAWGGICVSNHNGRVIPVGQTITLRGVAVLGFGSNGLLGHDNNRWDAEQVLIGNSLWNHTLYAANGRYRDLTVTGFAWTHLTPTAMDVENFVYERPAPAPYRYGGVLGQRGFDVFSNDDFPGTGIGVLPTGLRGGFRVNGYVADGRGPDSPAFALGGGAGPGTRFEGAILLRETGSNAVFSEGHNGYMKGLWSDTRFDRVLTTRARGGENNGFVAIGPFQGLVSTSHVDIQLDADYNTGYRTPITLTTSWTDAVRGPGAGALAGTRPWDNVVVQVVRDLYSGVATWSAFGFTNRLNRANEAYGGPTSPLFQADPHAPGYDARSGGSRLFVSNAKIRNNGNSVVLNPGSDLTGVERHVAFFVRDTELRLYDSGMEHTGLLRRLAYLENVRFVGGDTDREPRRVYRSEDTKTRSATGGETTLEIPTDLFYTPVEPWTVGDRSFSGGRVSFSGSAAAKVSGYTWAKRTNTVWDDWRAPVLRVTFSHPLAAGETLTATMAVRPWPQGVTVPAD